MLYYKNLSPIDDVNGFNCSSVPLNEFLVKSAVPHQNMGFSKTTCVYDDSNILVAYYTLAISTVEPDELPRGVTRGSPGYKIPTIVIAKFAVDKRQTGQGYGSAVLRKILEVISAFLKTAPLSARTVTIDTREAENQNKIKAFYRQFGFAEYPENSGMMYIKASKIKNLFPY